MPHTLRLLPGTTTHPAIRRSMLLLFDHCRHLSNSQANLQPMDRIYKGLLPVATRHRSPRGNDATQQKGAVLLLPLISTL
ncbi:hypothetical protein HPB50_029064 [Hyalomma asiaticum]|nr:hypothetical protein HPB50_029064 [Hyalomma asiaticum]